MNPRSFALLDLPQPPGFHPLTRGLDRDAITVSLGERLAGQGRAEVGIIPTDDSEDSAADQLGYRVVWVLAAMA